MKIGGSPAGQSEVPDRGRGGIRQPAFRRRRCEHMRERLACDLVVSADGAMWRPDRPSMTVASRGLVALEVTVDWRGEGSSFRPPWRQRAQCRSRRLPRLLASLHDEDGRVIVEGFLDGTSPPDPASSRRSKRRTSMPRPTSGRSASHEPDPIANGRELLIRQWLEPTLEFNGISGGYQGRGTKTVIPATASAKITCRLVAGQEPDHVVAVVKRHLEARLPTRLRARGSPAWTRKQRRFRRSRPAGAEGGRRSARRAAWGESRCGSRWAQRSRSARPFASISAPRRSSSPSPPPTRTITRRTSSSGLRISASA